MPKRNLILFDDQAWSGLLPLTWLRPVADIRIGLLTMAERWERLLTGRSSRVTQSHLAEAFPLAIAQDNFFINAAVLPTRHLAAAVRKLNIGDALVLDDILIAARLEAATIESLSADGEYENHIDGHSYDECVRILRRPFDIFRYNGAMIEFDVQLVTHGRRSKKLSKSNTVIGDYPIFLEKGAICEAAIINATKGPVYLGKDATIEEGAMLRGPLAICDNATVKMGAKIYGNTTIGPHCKAGGEVSNVVFQAYSNKGHDGYLGNAVIGQWCNIGADTNASNLKNNYTHVKVWSYDEDRSLMSDLQFCGLIMGDHAKCGINTMFNTGTVVGIAANIYGGGFPRTFLPDFSWGGASKLISHRLDKAFETAELMMQRRGIELSEADRKAMKYVFEQTSKYRSWEKSDA